MNTQPNPRLRRERTARARELRQNQTLYEGILWKLLRDRRLEGHKFRRQHPIDRFVADFACAEAKLVIELDGNSHDERIEQDAVRDEFLAQNGWHTLRIPNAELMQNGNGVVLTVLHSIATR